MGWASTEEGADVIRCVGGGVDIGAGGVQYELSVVGIGGLDTPKGVYIGGLRLSVDIIFTWSKKAIVFK